MNLPWHQYLMGLVYVFAGINHFRNPRLYLKIIPSYIPNPKLLNQLSGFAEIILGIGLCIALTSSWSAIGIIVLLIAVFPANLYMYQNEKARLGLPKWATLIRLPLQLILIYWAYIYIK
ncbi:DoxX family protein [uncultured Flavobacterium sp.]|uniref:DoxX family protein n=1 Tax=uncultured Flavobacterium sp. TaxID=165435 RepID=UPI0030ED2339|tara:strand:- start:231 stop:587 length:357 start_codon:yes stop_codon:yes gene_type:complete